MMTPGTPKIPTVSEFTTFIGIQIPIFMPMKFITMIKTAPNTLFTEGAG